MPFWRRAAAPAVLLVLALVALGANPFNNQTTGPFDLLTAMPGWSQTSLGHVRNAERSDIVDWQLPQWQWAKEQLRAGEWPLWNWTRGGGVPGFFDLSLGMASPSFLLFAATNDPATGFYLSTVLRLLVAGLGMFGLLRFELARLPSLFGAVTFMFSGFIAAWLYWPQTATLMWFPWLLLGMFRFLRAPGPGGWLLLVLVALLLILGGFPSVAAYCFYACGLAQLVYGWVERFSIAQHVRYGLLVLAALVSALALAAPWIAGLYEVLEHVDVSYRNYGASGTLVDLLSSLLPMQAFDAARVESARYSGTLALLFAVAAAVLIRHRSPSVLLASVGLALTLFGAVFLSGLMPKEWVAHVPAINNSTWDRLASIQGTGLAILGAVGAALVFQWVAAKSLRLATPLLIGLLLAQSADQMKYFRTFNGPVSADLVYPQTATIDYLVANTAPLQGILADQSFLFSGTLNYFGLSEWFAHGFKSGDEKKVLEGFGEGLFKSPTAASFPLSQIDTSSSLATALGIRYFVGHTLGASIPTDAFVVNGHEPAPPLPTAHWRQQFVLAESETILGVELLLATYHESRAPAAALLSFFAGDALLAQARVPADAIADNAWVYFDFLKPLELDSGTYDFAVTLENYRGPKQLTGWSAKSSDAAQLFVDGTPSGLSLKFNLATPVPLPLRLQRFDRRVSVIENKSVTSNAYFVSALDSAPAEIEYSPLTSARLLPDQSIELSYAGSQPGWVVLPVRQLPGWHARNANTLLTTSTYLGMLPAFAVDGPTTIQYRYRSRWLGTGFWVAGTAALLLLLFAIAAAWRRNA